jgi:hypothetical protein
MKLFQQLLVAPAALGLMAPVAVSAAELNINGVGSGTATFRILGLVETPNNAYGANADVRVRFNEHKFLSATGV